MTVIDQCQFTFKELANKRLPAHFEYLEQQVSNKSHTNSVKAPQADRVNQLMADLLGWLKVSDVHPLITRRLSEN